MPEYTVKHGDCISSLAAKHGLVPRQIWEHANNARLKEQRKDGNILLPGDSIFLPDKQPRQEPGATEQRHRFRRKGVPEKLRVVLRLEGEPRTNAKCIIDIDGTAKQDATDGEGRITISIPPGARRGKITLAEGGEEFELDLGGLDPVAEITGVQSRLANLGYPVEVTGQWDEESAEALKQYQTAKGLKPTGEVDEQIRKKLEEEHGS